jgi:hypothetical protein
VPLFFSALSALATSTARAEDAAPRSLTHEYSAYEKESLAKALSETQRALEPAPEGKIIEGWDVVTLDVFEERDPVPRFFNVFHWTSLPYTISRELLLRDGDRYRGVLIDETARNLRALSNQLSLVMVVPVRGSGPDRVRILLITKDVWSLRLNSNFRYVAGRLEDLILQPSEQNVFGTHHVAAFQFRLRPLSYNLGGYYRIPWLFGTRIQAIANANVIMNRERDQPEGSFGSFVLRRPLFSTRTEWSWEARTDWTYDVYRNYQNGALAFYDAREATPNVDDRIPWEFRRSLLTARVGATRSFGWAFKNDVSFGFEANERSFRTYDLSGFDPAAAAEFVARRVPTSDRRIGPYVQYRTYRTDFMRVLDVEILGLQEDFRLGHDIVATVYPLVRAFGSTRDVLGTNLRAQYTQPLHDGFVRASAEGTVEAQIDRIADAKIESRIRIVSPSTGLGRMVFDGGWIRRFRNYLNSNEFLGGGSRPRGWPTASLVGANAVAYTVEWRTRAVEILKTQWGLVGFFDAGDAYDRPAELTMRHSVGLGVRALFPQFDRQTFRLDVGFPIAPGGQLPRGVQPVGFIFTVGQAFDPPNVTSSVGLD